MEISLTRRTIWRFFVAVIALLAAADVSAHVMTVLGYNRVYGLVPAFLVGREANVPTWYSSVALAFAAATLGLISALVRRGDGRYASHWAALAVIFLLLSADEVVGFHEMTVAPTTAILGNFLRYISWVVPASLLLVVFASAFWRFFWSLPPATRRGMALAGTVYVGGALGMELITGAFGRVWDARLHFAFDLTEEVMEMTGVVLLILTLTAHIRRHFGPVTITFGAPATK